MQIGIDSFVSTVTDPELGRELAPVERVAHLLEEIEMADRSGVDTFGIGEHHRKDFLASAPTRVLVVRTQLGASCTSLRLTWARQSPRARVGLSDREHRR